MPNALAVADWLAVLVIAQLFAAFQVLFVTLAVCFVRAVLRGKP